MSNNSTFDNLIEQKEEVLQQLEEISKGEKRKIRSMMMISKKLSTHGTSQQLIYIIKPERIQRRNAEKKRGTLTSYSHGYSSSDHGRLSRRQEMLAGVDGAVLWMVMIGRDDRFSNQ